MKYPKERTTAKAGVNYIEKIINSQGSVFRPVHQEDDFGIDGFIELVCDEEASGRLIAVQVKSGDSYLSGDGKGFVVPVDQRHIDYWCDFTVPVILVCYSPSLDFAAYIVVRDYVEIEEYYRRMPVTSIPVLRRFPFTTKALSNDISALAHTHADERILLKSADKCLSEDPDVRRSGFGVLSQHPDSRGLKITALMARRLLLDDDVAIGKEALRILGYGVGRKRWSWNPGNREENEIIDYTSALCSGLTEDEIRRAIALADKELLSGPTALVERCFDVLMCSELAYDIVQEILYDADQPLDRRVNCLYMLCYADTDDLEGNAESYRADTRVTEVVEALIGPAELGSPTGS
jgi:hypothetical protein